MPTTESGFVIRRVVRGCGKLCKGFHKPEYDACFSRCISKAQTGQPRGMGLVPKRGARSCSKDCPTADGRCLEACFKRKLTKPSKPETMYDVRKWEEKHRRRRKRRR